MRSSIVGETKTRILLLLMDGEDYQYSLLDRFDISQPSLHEHLQDLESAGLIERDERGDRVYYSLTNIGETFSEALQSMEEYQAENE
ncbi:MAG: winged helix-turn-helix domain-containing protein [Candidatus Nanohaloarchaeota archaeon QJJ-5]|nr:winged helix-turn-helix domain-containing protein [Candidatus Nanohaloarchaeota archaeon QJJ-5]